MPKISQKIDNMLRNTKKIKEHNKEHKIATHLATQILNLEKINYFVLLNCRYVLQCYLARKGRDTYVKTEYE